MEINDEKSSTAGNPPPYSGKSPGPSPVQMSTFEQTSPVVVAKAEVVVPIVVGTKMGTEPSPYVCESCHAQVVTRVETKVTTKTHLFAGLLCFLGKSVQNKPASCIFRVSCRSTSSANVWCVCSLTRSPWKRGCRRRACSSSTANGTTTNSFCLQIMSCSDCYQGRNETHVEDSSFRTFTLCFRILALCMYTLLCGFLQQR